MVTKIKTFEQPQQTAAETEHPNSSNWDDIGHYVTSLTNEADFITLVEEQGLANDSLEYAEALSRYTDDTLAQQEGLVDEKTATQIRLVAGAPYVTHASLAMNELRARRMGGRRLPREEWNAFNHMKKQAVLYNQLLNEYMYQYPDDSFSALSQAISDQALDHSGRDTQTAANAIEGVVRGARTEAATRHLFDDCAVPYRAATPEEDLRGADVILTLPGAEYDLDIKKSLDQLASNNGGYDFTETRKLYSIAQNRSGHKKILFFPGFTDVDLGDKLRLDRATTEARQDIIRIQLTLAIQEITS